MSTQPPAPKDSPDKHQQGMLVPLLSHWLTQLMLGMAILGLDLFTGRYLQFPILFVLPVALAAWYRNGRNAGIMAVLLPVGRLSIAIYEEVGDPILYLAGNCLIRILLLAFIAFLVGRTSRQNAELNRQLDNLVTVCAWSRTVEFEGEWISFEDYLKRKFNIHTSHGISPAEAEKLRQPHRKS
jgi:hypothetical protein